MIFIDNYCMFNLSLKKIKFTAEENLLGTIPEPTPAERCLPEYYKRANIHAYEKAGTCPVHSEGGLNFTNFTFKACAPFYDSLVTGYIIKLPCDVLVETLNDENDITFRWTTTLIDPPIQTHDYHQTKELPIGDQLIGGKTFKFNNPWFIETPPGYSVWIVPPFNRFEDRFEIIPAIVDTDLWHGQVTFPFIWKKMPYKGLIKQGTPIAQIIPFKRDKFKQEVRYNVPKSYRSKLGQLFNVVEKGYKRLWWQKKYYR